MERAAVQVWNVSLGIYHEYYCQGRPDPGLRKGGDRGRKIIVSSEIQIDVHMYVNVYVKVIWLIDIENKKLFYAIYSTSSAASYILSNVSYKIRRSCLWFVCELLHDKQRDVAFSSNYIGVYFL